MGKIRPVAAKTKHLKGGLDTDKTEVDKYQESGELRMHLLEKGKIYRLRNFLNKREKRLFK